MPSSTSRVDRGKETMGKGLSRKSGEGENLLCSSGMISGKEAAGGRPAAGELEKKETTGPGFQVKDRNFVGDQKADKITVKHNRQ